jgi:hypothetical protein
MDGFREENRQLHLKNKKVYYLNCYAQGLSAEEQETQREEWKAELSKTEEEILTLKQVLASKERHAAGS